MKKWVAAQIDDKFLSVAPGAHVPIRPTQSKEWGKAETHGPHSEQVNQVA